MLNAAYEAHKANPGVKVPYSKFDLINTFNAWKRSPAAAREGAGSPGLAWRDEVIAQVFEEGLADLSCAVKRFFDARKQGGKHQGFPGFKKRGRGKVSFRLRNRATDIRVNLHSIRLPKLGELPVCESTRRLRLFCARPPGPQLKARFYLQQSFGGQTTGMCALILRRSHCTQINVIRRLRRRLV